MAIDLARRRLLHLPQASSIRLSAAIGLSCFAARGIVCQSCADHCPEAAIRFRPRLGSPALPDIESARCTGCGDCMPVCPTAAIELRPANV